MPGLVLEEDRPRKRMRGAGDTFAQDRMRSSKVSKTSATEKSSQADILLLEEQILDSQRYYNNILVLQKLVSNNERKPKTATFAAIALCRVFCRLIAGEKLVKRNGRQAEVEVAQWLKGRLSDYVESLSTWIGSPDAKKESTALTLLMRVVKAETSQDAKRAEQAWRTEKSTFVMVVKTLLGTPDAAAARQEYVQTYVEEFDDVRFYTMLAMRRVLSTQGHVVDESIRNALEMLVTMEGIPEAGAQLQDWYGQVPEPDSHQLLSLSAHRKTAQECWLSIFRLPLKPDHRKTILSVMTPQILPWFTNRLEVLTDFLTDSFDAGGSTSLVALSGIYKLMTEKNIDYPDFYTKLYSLLDEDVLHSKHRSRFFKMLDRFMSSSHLPAAMIASFIKRLSRLSLQAPPGAVVWIVPWVYNMLKSHPTCTFMLHRSYHPAHSIYSLSASYSEEGMDDPFKALATDPMHTEAIESSLWELHTLQDHWHPNVASLAKILGEQFTKRDYQLDDFLDHNYAGLIEAELSKGMKRTVEIESEIPKRIVTSDESEGLNGLGSLLYTAVEAL